MVVTCVRWLLHAACALLFWLIALDVRADDAELARSWFERGVAASEAGDWQRAQSAFLESQQRAPKATTLFNLALSQLRLELFDEALTTLDAFDALADPELHQHLIDRAGAVRLEAEAMASRERIRTIEHSLQLQARAAGPGPDLSDARTIRLGRSLIGTGSALVLGAVGAGFWWRDRAQNLDDCQLADGVTCREEQQITRQSRAAAGLTVTLAVAGVGLVVTGAVWLARRGRAGQARSLPPMLAGSGALFYF